MSKNKSPDIEIEAIHGNRLDDDPKYGPLIKAFREGKVKAKPKSGDLKKMMKKRSLY